MDVRTTSPAQLFRPSLVAVGLASAAAVAVTFLLYPSAHGLLLALGFALLAGCSTVDLATFRVPDGLAYTGLALMLASAAVLGDIRAAMLGALVGGGLLFLISIVSRGRLGAGDAKLAAFGGAIVGGRYVIHALFLGSVAAATFGLVLMLSHRLGREESMPFAPFLTLGFVFMALATGSTLGL